MKKRALIFGLAGQDGAYLSEFLLGKGYSVFGTSRDAQMSTFANLERLGIRDRVTAYSANPVDFRSVLDVLTKTEPDEVYNLAGQSSVGLSFEQPADTFTSIAMANITLLEVIRFLGGNIRYYNACSTECFGNSIAPATEETPFYPRSPYAVAKAASFWQVAYYRDSCGLFACSGILSNHESPLRPERFVTQKIVRSAVRISRGSGEILSLGNIDICRDWGWAPEYVQAMWLMLQKETPEDFIVATGHTISLRDFLFRIFTCLGMDWNDHVRIEDTFLRPSDITESHVDPSKAAKKLGWVAKYRADSVARLLVEAEMERK